MSLIQVSNLTFCYEGSCDNIFENVSFQIDTDWRLGLTGRNGRGKTTLLRLLQGMYPHRGTIRASVGFDYFPYTVPDPEECPPSMTMAGVRCWGTIPCNTPTPTPSRPPSGS